MNIANKLTILRVLLVPVFLVFLLWDVFGAYGKWIALAVFIIAAVTDCVDGKLARKYNLVTNFGKFVDPVADKMLVCSALIALVEMGRIAAWIVIIIIARDSIVNGLRLVAADAGVVIAAGKWGKYKTVFQMIMIGFLVANLEYYPIQIVTQLLIWISLILTIVSLIDYVYKNRSLISMDR